MSGEQRVSWQQCPECGGVFIVWADPEAPPIHEHNASRVQPDWFTYRDGSVPTEGQIIHCNDCGTTDYIGLLPRQRRWGPELPPPPPLPQPGLYRYRTRT